MAMWLFLGSECLLFGGLISTYMLYRNRQAENLGPDQLWDIPFTSASSFVLLMSSLTMVLGVTRGTTARRPAQRQVVAGRHGHARFAVRGRPGLRVHDVLPRGSGLHHEPVLVELLHTDRFPRRARHRRHHHVAVTGGDAVEERVLGDKGETVEMVGLYWHFVDIVWILIFTLVYLIPA
jgi:heme/copper-type cytochrome/quinol oxidase subunit 3